MGCQLEPGTFCSGWLPCSLTDPFEWEKHFVIMFILQVSHAVMEAFVPTDFVPLEWVDQEINSGLPSRVQNGKLGLDMGIECCDV